MTITTLGDVHDASTADLVRHYNKITGKSIKGFHDRKKAIEQTWNAIQKQNASAIPASPVKRAKSTKKEGSSMSSKREASFARVIRLQVKENPKRKDTKGYEKFAALMKCDGETVQKYRDQEGKHPNLDDEKSWPMGELRWCIKQGFIKLEDAAKLAKAS